MTGKEFYEKIHRIKEITKIEWEVQGEDPLDPDIAKVKMTADGEEFSVLVGYPKITAEIGWWQRVALILVLQKIEGQTGKKNPYIASHLSDAINYARYTLEGWY